MIHAEDVSAGHRGRRHRSMAEKRRIVEQTLEPGVSVAQVALANGVNANQVFVWRRAFKRGELVDSGSTALLSVVMASTPEALEADRAASAAEPVSGNGAIHIEFPGRVVISVERGADAALLRSVLESLRK
jgi:transposase